MQVRRRTRRGGTGDDTFEVLFRREFEPLVRALTLVAGDPEAAADAVQDAFVQAHRHWDHVLTLESPTGWVRHVAVNRIRNQHRGRQRQEAALPRLLGIHEVGGIECERHDELVRALVLLPPQQRTAVALYYLLDQPTSVVADYLGTTEATVRSHLRTARRRLHRQIGDDFKEGNG
jgi:RNA polymerase sigma-70 factor (ECF subfamily)